MRIWARLQTPFQAISVSLNTPFVRPALPPDADAVFGLARAFATSYSPVRSAFDINYPRVLEDTDSDLLVAEQDGVVVGYALVRDSLTLFANGVVTEVLELYVVEEARGKGIGRSLVRQVVDRAKDRGAVEVTVPTRRAGSFYVDLGFERTAEFFKLRL